MGSPILEGQEEQVESWRLQVLLGAKYEMPHAEKLAASDADLHEAVEVREAIERDPSYKRLKKSQRSKLAFRVVY